MGEKKEKGWNKLTFGKIFEIKNTLGKIIKEVQDIMETGLVDEETCAKERDLRSQWFKINKKEEIFRKQKSRVQWLTKGDRNTKFFHQLTLKHRSRNRIRSLVKEDDSIVTNEKEIAKEVVDFFSSYLLNLGNAHLVNVDFLEVIPNVISDLDLKMVSNVVSMEEFKRVFFSFGSFKTPGLDGFPPFFQNY